MHSEDAELLVWGYKHYDLYVPYVLFFSLKLYFYSCIYSIHWVTVERRVARFYGKTLQIIKTICALFLYNCSPHLAEIIMILTVGEFFKLTLYVTLPGSLTMLNCSDFYPATGSDLLPHVTFIWIHWIKAKTGDVGEEICLYYNARMRWG